MDSGYPNAIEVLSSTKQASDYVNKSYAKGGKITDSMIWNNMQDDGDIIEHWASDVGGSNESVDNIITYSNGKKYLVTTNFDQDMLLTPSKIATEWEDEYAKGGKTQGYNDRLDESLGSRRGTSMSHHQNYKDRRDESKGMETGMGRRAYRGVNTMDNN